MPECGSQVILCDLPIRLDTYGGACAHMCAYCFARAKRPDFANVRPGESVRALIAWISGKRTQETRWCDWDIPLHWGGMSDPFQPCEALQGRSLACLKLFAESGYPVVISTKGTALLTSDPYLSVLSKCNAAVQVSMVAPGLDAQEPGAPRFRARLRALPQLVRAARRVIVRCQPFMPRLLRGVLKAIPRYAAAGVHGITVEAYKSRKARPGMQRLGGSDWVYPLETLRPAFEELRDAAHAAGMRFYAAENRLRALGDDRCCCGVGDLPGWRVNRANLNALVRGEPIRYTRTMRVRGTGAAFKSLAQNAVRTPALAGLSYAECMEIARRVPTFRAMLGLADRPTRQEGDGGAGEPQSQAQSGPAGGRVGAKRQNACEREILRPGVSAEPSPAGSGGIERGKGRLSPSSTTAGGGPSAPAPLEYHTPRAGRPRDDAGRLLAPPQGPTRRRARGRSVARGSRRSRQTRRRNTGVRTNSGTEARS